MSREPIPEREFQKYWQRLQAMGLNAYEARSYLVLLGHPRFKAIELAGRAHVPRQKIYEVLDSLAEKGFASVIQDRTKLFSAIAPEQALPAYLARRNRDFERQLAEQGKAAAEIVSDLTAAYTAGRDGAGGLDALQVVHDAGQIAERMKKLLREATTECLAILWTPQAAEAVLEAHTRGLACRALAERGSIDAAAIRRCRDAGLEVRETPRASVKVVVAGAAGLLALTGPVKTQPQWTAVFFEHPGMAEAMMAVFEEYWKAAS